MCRRAVAPYGRWHDEPGAIGRMGSRSSTAGGGGVGRGRARPRSARAVRRPGALWRRLGGSRLGVGRGSPRDRVALPRAGDLRAVGCGGRRCARMRAAVAGVRNLLRSDPAVTRSARAPPGRHRFAGRPHRDRDRAGGRGTVADGGGGGPPEGPPRRAVGARRDRAPHGPGRHVVRLQPRQQGRDAEVRGAVVAAHARAAGARVRHVGGGRPAAPADDGRAARRRWPALRQRAAPRRVHLGDELRDDVRDRARDRLRAVHRGPFPRRARRRPVAARRDREDDGHGRQGRACQRAHRDRRSARGHARAGPDVPLRAARDRAGGAVGPRGDPDAAAGRCCPRSVTASTAAGYACPTRPAIAASASPPGAAGCGRDRCRTPPARSRSCSSSPRPRSDCARGCRRSPWCPTTPTHARATRS